MKTRLLKDGIITTILGVGLLGVCAYLVLKDMDAGASLTEASQAVSGWIAASVMLLRSKDSLIGRNINNAAKDKEERENALKS